MTVPVKNRPITAGEFMTWAMRQAEGSATNWRHYLVLSTRSRAVVHHARAEADRIETRIVRSCPLHLDPPGLTVKVESFFES
jgi:hypothetical protein